MSQVDIKIMADPISAAACKFTVDRPVLPGRAYSFASREAAEGSPLAERLFAIEGVAAVQISHDRITVTQSATSDWREIGPKIGAAIREHISSGDAAVDEKLWDALPPEDIFRERVQEILDREINPAVAAHGGSIQLLDVRGNIVFIQMGGGCQGCGMASVTLKQGVEKSLRAAIPEIGDILDVTDHASGQNPYYSQSAS